MIIGYDFEVFRYNWCVVFIDPINHERKVIWDNPEELRIFHTAHTDSIYIGYNSRHYDQYVTTGIICGFSAYKINNFIITDKNLKNKQVLTIL